MTCIAEIGEYSFFLLNIILFSFGFFSVGVVPDKEIDDYYSS